MATREPQNYRDNAQKRELVVPSSAIQAGERARMTNPARRTSRNVATVGQGGGLQWSQVAGKEMVEFADNKGYIELSNLGNGRYMVARGSGNGNRIASTVQVFDGTDATDNWIAARNYQQTLFNYGLNRGWRVSSAR